MVSGLGLEPRMTGPKPVVIPFHHPELKLIAAAQERFVGEAAVAAWPIPLDML